MLKQTPFFDKHLALDAKLVDFHGWQLPLSYRSQLEEHMAVREASGLFDVSHMTIVDILGTGGRQFLKQLLSNDVDVLNAAGRSMYSLMLNHQGGIIDDLIVYYRSPDSYRLVLNSATRSKDLEWLQKQSSGLSIGIQERDDLCMLAVQGPKAIETTLECLPTTIMDSASTLEPFTFSEYDNWFIAQTGYTGEKGFEVIGTKADMLEVWDELQAAGVQPCGLGARDSLRIEAGLLLHGQDMDATTNPYQSGLGWTVSLKDETRDFIGKAALELYRNQSPETHQYFVGIILEEKGMIRTGQKLYADGEVLGEITSGTYSPVLNQSIGFGRIRGKVSEGVSIEIRDRQVPVKVVKPRFVKNGQIIVTEV